MRVVITISVFTFTILNEYTTLVIATSLTLVFYLTSLTILGQNNWSSNQLNDFNKYQDDWHKWLPGSQVSPKLNNQKNVNNWSGKWFPHSPDQVDTNPIIDSRHNTNPLALNGLNVGSSDQFTNLFSGSQGNSNWDGKWFPHNPNEIDNNPTVNYNKSSHDSNHGGIVMGVYDPNCDDAQTNLTQDWNLSPENYTCYDDKSLYLPRSDVHPMHSTEHIPVEYSAPHKCMNESITYSENIPTFGPHRPLWAVYGEYSFLPRQRWVHNLEHGSVIMLYHPCANKYEVNQLRKIVSNCLYRHIITPFNLLSITRPLALVTWGHRLEMSKLAPDVVVKFIKQHALNGPEQTSREGQYSLMLEQKAKIVTNINDTTVCPQYNSDIHMK